MSDNKLVNLMFAFLRSKLGRLIYILLKLALTLFIIRQLVFLLISLQELHYVVLLKENLIEKFKWLDNYI
jgi:hypothetical protein